MAEIISVVNQKGGVGKTTTSINLAAILSETGYKVLLLDFDPQANASSGLGLSKEKVTTTVYDALFDPGQVDNAIYASPVDTLSVLAASTSLAGAEVELNNVEKREFRLKAVVDKIKGDYDYIVIDCAPSLGLLTVNALVASQKVLVPVQCEYYALEGVAQLMQTLTLVGKHLNPELEIMGVLLTMYDPRTSLNQLVVENAKAHFKSLVFDTVIPRNVRLAEAPSHGLPIILYNPRSTGAHSYYQFTKELLHRVHA